MVAFNAVSSQRDVGSTRKYTQYHKPQNKYLKNMSIDITG